MKSDLSIIITLFKTPIDKLETLNQYKNYPILIFDQETENNSENISKILTGKFEYFHSKKNIGLCKSTNFLIPPTITANCSYGITPLKVLLISLISF